MTFGDRGLVGIFTRSWSDFDRGTVLNEIVVGLTFLSSSNDLVRSG